MHGSSSVLHTLFSKVVLPALALPMTRIRKWVYFLWSFTASTSLIVVRYAGALRGGCALLGSRPDRTGTKWNAVNGIWFWHDLRYDASVREQGEMKVIYLSYRAYVHSTNQGSSPTFIKRRSYWWVYLAWRLTLVEHSVDFHTSRSYVNSVRA